MQPQPPKKLVSVMRIYFNHPIIVKDKLVTFCDFETWYPNEANLKIINDDYGFRITWEREDIREHRFIPWSSIAIGEVKNYDVSP